MSEATSASFADDYATNVTSAERSADRQLIEAFKQLWPVDRWRQCGYFTEDYLELINEHWLQFSPPPELVQKVLGVVYLLFSTGGCLGNLMVLLMYIK